MNTSKMKKAAFKVGQVVEYLGDRHATDEKGRDLIKKGMRFTIEEIHQPRKGVGTYGVDEETGDDLIDGYNVVRSYPGHHGRIIWPADKDQWRAIPKAACQ